MGVDGLGQGQAGALEDARPDDAVEPRDVLPDYVHIGRPELGQRVVRVLMHACRCTRQTKTTLKMTSSCFHRILAGVFPGILFDVLAVVPAALSGRCCSGFVLAPVFEVLLVYIGWGRWTSWGVAMMSCTAAKTHGIAQGSN